MDLERSPRTLLTNRPSRKPQRARNRHPRLADTEQVTLWIWHHEGRAVLELDDALELLVYFGDGVTRAAWLWSQTGRVLAWARVGVA